MARIDVKKLYSELNDEDYFCVSDYDRMVHAFGQRVLVKADDDDYQGDSYRLLADGDELGQRYGLLIFGWGSCSGCDALLSCGSVADVQELADSLQDSIKWFSDKEALKKYMQEHDWEGDWTWHREASHQFRTKVMEFLDSDQE